MNAPTLDDLPTPEALPDDPAALRAIITELLALIARQAGDIEGLEHRLRTLLRRHVGPRADRIEPAQILLFANQIAGQQPPAESPPDQPAPTDPPAPATEEKKKTKRGGNKRKALPAHLPRDRVIHRPPEADEPCPCCGTEVIKIGEELTETLNYIPASFRVTQDVREKYACPGCRESGIAIAELPPRPLHRGRYGPGFIAWVVVSKYADHLPLYRLVRIAARSRLELAISTLVDVIALAATLLAPIVEAMRREMLADPIIHSDDTRMPVIIGRGPAHNGRIRVYIGADDEGDFTHIVFQYSDTGEGRHNREWLDGFAGTLCVDGSTVTDALFRLGVEEAGCLAHLRRYFVDAQQNSPLEASTALAYIKRIYEVERRAKAQRLTPDARLALRRAESAPIFEALYAWIDEQTLVARPKSPLGVALRYARNQRVPCSRFLEDGRLEVDNNISERELRGPVVGRHNYKFQGSPEAAERAAIHYTLAASCRLHGIDPFAWFLDVLLRVATHPADRMIELSPRYWKPLGAA